MPGFHHRTSLGVCGQIECHSPWIDLWKVTQEEKDLACENDNGCWFIARKHSNTLWLRFRLWEGRRVETCRTVVALRPSGFPRRRGQLQHWGSICNGTQLLSVPAIVSSHSTITKTFKITSMTSKLNLKATYLLHLEARAFFILNWLIWLSTVSKAVCAVCVCSK